MAKPKEERLAIVNQKGGTGKTTVSVNLSVGLAERKYKVLLIDLDPQHNATLSLGINSIDLPVSTYEVLLRETTLEETLIKTPISNLTLAPAKMELSNADINLAGESRYQFRLRESLNPITNHYDYILVDCPPSLGLLTINALVAADSVIIPILCDYLSLEGLKQLITSIEKVQQGLNSDLEVLGILPNMVDFRLNISKESLNLVKNHFKGLVFKGIIRTCVKVKEAPSFGKSIFDYAPHSTGAKEYTKLVTEVIRRVKG
ncbi:MAG: AAA family ATPase [Candidatus Aerophobetes bacterium]|nr:AAA family ATPase [Candidatus Aerophobetes bacterium]